MLGTKRLLPIGVGLGIVLGTALVQGKWTQRWNPSRALETATARLHDVPLTVGDWQGEALDLDPEAVVQAKLSGAWMRRYTNRKSGDSMTVLLMCGRGGPVSVHTPEWCYGGIGYEMVGAPVPYRVVFDAEAPPTEFRTARFSRAGSALPDHLRIFWAWNAAGSWEVPPSPRLAFGGYPALYKLYVLHTLTSLRDPLDKDRGQEFLRQLLPALSRALFPRDEPVGH